MEVNREYLEKLDSEIREYNDSPCEQLLYEVLFTVFEGIAENQAVICPVEFDPDMTTCQPLFLRKKNDMEHLAIFTDPDDLDYPTTANLRLQGLIGAILDLKSCEGIIINPNSDRSFFVPKLLLLSAFYAALKMQEACK